MSHWHSRYKPRVAIAQSADPNPRPYGRTEAEVRAEWSQAVPLAVAACETQTYLLLAETG